MKNDAEPKSYLDDEGRFYKPATDGLRTEREIQFYAAVFPETAEAVERPHAALPIPEAESEAGAAVIPKLQSAAPRLQDIEGLAPFVPRFFGTLEYEGTKLIALEDKCRIYKKPCVMDCKLGFTTVYEWADERYKNKFKIKDAETTQNSVGFRVSGLQVYRSADESVFKPERDWSRKLNKDNIGSAMLLFASGSHLPPKDLYCDPEYGILKQLRRFEAWSQQQTSFQFFQSSILIMYEGKAKSMEQANVQVVFVDFAHAFQAIGGVCDNNLVGGIAALISVIEAAVGEK